MNRDTLDLARRIVADFNDGDHKPDYAQLGYDLATAVLAWAETAGQAGTHAYDLMASYAQRDADVSEALIHLTAATVLAQGIDRKIVGWNKEPYGRSVSFSPLDMDATFRDYDVQATRDGLITTVRITPKPSPNLGLLSQDEDPKDALPQAEEHVYDRPVWAIRYYATHGGPYFARMQDRNDCERHLSDYMAAGMADPIIENRMCLHAECASDICKYMPVADPEVTSDS